LPLAYGRAVVTKRRRWDIDIFIELSQDFMSLGRG
jgi:hypothetical protein